MCEIMEKIAKEEHNEGRIEGETRINTLNTILINLNRFECCYGQRLSDAAYDRASAGRYVT